jgi:hypothetical protein
MEGSYNSTFLVLIPKLDSHYAFDEFGPISLCHCLYKNISMVITIRIKPLLSNVIYSKQFGFLKGILIHETIGTGQEGLHSIKTP